MCSHSIRTVLIITGSMLLLPAKVAAERVSATEIWFTEKEPATATYAVRMLVTEKYLRIDDGADAGDFVLLDRSARIIYSLSHEDRSILVIPARPVDRKEPTEHHHRTERVPLDDSPSITGKEVTLYRLYTDDKVCVEVAAAESLLPEAVSALSEFHSLLAGEHAAVALRTPEDLMSACDLTDNVFRPRRYLQFGFPVTVRFSNGRERLLNRYGVREVDESLFDLPPDYRELRTPA